jgi:hypothetical protein
MAFEPTLLGEVMATSTVTAGGTTPLPPLAQPLAMARLNSAAANPMRLIMIKLIIRYRSIIGVRILFGELLSIGAAARPMLFCKSAG